MITLIHGDDIASSRKYYKQLQKKDTTIVDGEKVSSDEVIQLLQSDMLFDDEKAIAFENFFSKRKPSKEMQTIIDSLQKNAHLREIVFWESKPLTKKMIDTFPKAISKSFTFPKSLFLFLDELKPNNTKKLLFLYHETLHHTDPEMILVMLTRQIRILLALSDQSADPIDEVARIAPWQKTKILQQAKQFSLDALKKLHSDVFALDVKSKTGGLSLPLSQTIDFFLIAI